MSMNLPPAHYKKIISDLEKEGQEWKKKYKELLISAAPKPPDNLDDLRSILESLFSGKTRKHIEILRLESTQKKTEFRIYLKKILLERCSIFNTENLDEMVCIYIIGYYIYNKLP